MNKKKQRFLALCLLEALEDENLSNANALLIKYNTIPSIIIYSRGISPIHFASGMENIIFAEKIMKLMLKNKDVDVNVQTADGETPLHIASFWGRENIVQMLLNQNANIDIKDNDNNTAIHCALHEYHSHILEIFKKFIFEKKFSKKINQLMISNENDRGAEGSLSAICTQKHKQLLNVNTINEKKFTPNRQNYNYDITSPYYINITHRKRKQITFDNHNCDGGNQKCKETTNDDNDDDDDDYDDAVKYDFDDDIDNAIVNENLFKLTEENLSEYSKSLQTNSENKSRKSLVNSWREKVSSYQTTTSRISSMYTVKDLDNLISNYDNFDLDNSKNYNNLYPLTSTLNKDDDDDDDDDKNKSISDDADTSFKTARYTVQTLDESNFIKSPKLNEYIIQMSEEYLHTDDENGIVLIENKLLPFDNINSIHYNKSQISGSTEYTLPLEYDTDTLRAELTQFGEAPGPITKSTKRLYVKRLIKYKRNPNLAIELDTLKGNTNQTYSVELNKTLKISSEWQNLISSYGDLETKLIEYFNSENSNKIKLREGHFKTSFIYLLIDPRISENLPGESKLISKHDAWQKFIASIFYVGKGKRSRPYSHLYDAIKIYEQYQQIQPNNGNSDDGGVDPNEDCNRKIKNLNVVTSQAKIGTSKWTNALLKNNEKLQKIIDIWKAGKGVVCLHIFHNILPAEAYTREAAIIDSIGLMNITNQKRGDYYGITQSWNCRMRRQLGVFLLYKSMQIFVQEGESQLKPGDLK